MGCCNILTGYAPPHTLTGAGMEMFICLECATVDVTGWSVNWVALMVP